MSYGLRVSSNRAPSLSVSTSITAYSTPLQQKTYKIKVPRFGNTRGHVYRSKPGSPLRLVGDTFRFVSSNRQTHNSLRRVTHFSSEQQSTLVVYYTSAQQACDAPPTFPKNLGDTNVNIITTMLTIT